VAAAVLTLGLSTLSASTAQPASVPQDALTLVRQALAALEVSPPDVGVAAERVIKALFARDTRGVDMPRVRDAQQALDDEDPSAAAAYLMEALRPAEAEPAGIDRTLLAPVRPRFVATPSAYGWLAAAALLMAAGGLIVRA
jgi:hypothetical protein